MKVGVLRFSALGDLALAMPFIRALTVKPVVLTMAPGQALYQDEFETFVILNDKRLRSLGRFVRAARHQRLDLLIDLQSNDRSRLLTRLSGARRIAERRGRFIAVVALARKLSGIMFALWRDGAVYQEVRSAHPL